VSVLNVIIWNFITAIWSNKASWSIEQKAWKNNEQFVN